MPGSCAISIHPQIWADLLQIDRLFDADLLPNQLFAIILVALPLN
jgi:hypothetical protein